MKNLIEHLFLELIASCVLHDSRVSRSSIKGCVPTGIAVESSFPFSLMQGRSGNIESAFADNVLFGVKLEFPLSFSLIFL